MLRVLQQFGTIETAEGPADAMLCVDADSPNEFMFQWRTQRTNPSAVGVVSNATWTGTAVRLTPKSLWHAVDKDGRRGGLYPVRPDAEGSQWIRGITAELNLTQTGLEGRWRGPDGTGGAIKLADHAAVPPINVGRFTSWSDFKAWADRTRAGRTAEWFRGHGSSGFALTTSLHRLGRHRLERFCFNELVAFKAQAEGVLNRRFDLNDGIDYATVVALAQHHGLPTPLLDWTASPYVAAFFAFSDALENRKSRSAATDIRVYGLSPEFVTSLAEPFIVLPFPAPYVNSLTVGPLHNPRLQAQQSRFLVTNVANLEAFIQLRQLFQGKQHLAAVDLPISCATEALKDLAFMGVTAATMFPGLDGVGRMMRQEMSYDAP